MLYEYIRKLQPLRRSLIDVYRDASFAIELTDGCSVRCAHCCVSAGKYKSFRPIDNSFKEFLQSLFDFGHRCGILYWATDPFDHPQYLEAARIYRDVFGELPYTSTSQWNTLPDELLISLHQVFYRDFDMVRFSMNLHKDEPDVEHKLNRLLRLIPNCRFSMKNFPSIYPVIRSGRAFHNASAQLPVLNGYKTCACIAGMWFNWTRQEWSLMCPIPCSLEYKNGYAECIMPDHSIDNFKSKPGVPQLIFENFYELIRDKISCFYSEQWNKNKHVFKQEKIEDTSCLNQDELEIGRIAYLDHPIRDTIINELIEFNCLAPLCKFLDGLGESFRSKLFAKLILSSQNLAYCQTE